MLILHLGLPKTGSTFLQNEVFPNFEGLTVLHRTVPPVSAFGRLGPHLLMGLKRLVKTENPFWSWFGQWVLVAVQSRGRVVFTAENLSLRPNGIWDGGGAGPSFYEQYLRRLKKKMGQSRLVVILGVRRWDTWLPSRYAQSATTFISPGQIDFETRVGQILETKLGNQDAPLGWLEYDSVYELLCRAIGPENVMVYRQEDLESDCVGVINRLSKILECRFSGEKMKLLANPDAVTKRNVKKVDSSTWRLRNSEETISVNSELQKRIIEKFQYASRLYNG